MKRKITNQLIDEFEDYLKTEEKSRATLEKYLRDVKSFAAYAQNKPLDKPLTLSYKTNLGSNYAPASANSMLAALNSFLKFIGRQDCCVKQFKIQKSAFCPKEKELSKTEYLALIRAAEQKENRRLSLVIQTICATGIRVSELRFITVEAIKKGESTVSCKGKTRRIFIPSALQKKLIVYAKKHGITAGAIFITKKGNPLNRSNIWADMKSLCKAAGVSPTKVFPHNLRHLFARTFYSIEKDVAKLADILGHSNLNTTRIYLLSTGEEHRRKMENMRLII